jgi:chromosome segregation ATPase
MNGYAGMLSLDEEIEKRIDELKARIEKLENRVKWLENPQNIYDMYKSVELDRARRSGHLHGADTEAEGYPTCALPLT